MAENANEVVAGVGTLYMAPYLTAEPASATATRDAAWVGIGYTEEGSTWSSEITSEDIEVAEELEPIGTASSKRTGTVTFSMAQSTRQTLSLALNLGVQVNNTTRVAPPDTGGELYVALLLETDQGARWYCRKSKNTGAFEMARAKTGKTLIGVEMGMFKDAGHDLFAVLPGAGGLI